MTPPVIAAAIVVALLMLVGFALRRGKPRVAQAMVVAVAAVIVLVPLLVPESAALWLLGAVAGLAIGYAFFVRPARMVHHGAARPHD